MMIDQETIQGAVQRLAGKVHRTPILTSSAIDRMTGRSVFFKCENLQKGGAFKYRGALNAVLHIPNYRHNARYAALNSCQPWS